MLASADLSRNSMRHAEIIAIGSELLHGSCPDTNSLFLTDRLGAIGIEVRFKTVVGDEEGDIESAIRTAAGRTDLVLLTGGLGPTCDDCTREAVARVTGRPLRRRAEALAALRRRLSLWGREPSPAQLRQALIPSGAGILANPVGSAPGFAIHWRRKLLAALPGVPNEAEQMFDASLAPRLAAERMSRHSQAWIERRIVQTFGLIESDVDHRLKPVKSAGRSIHLGLLASPLGVCVSVTARVSHHTSAELDRLMDMIRKQLGACIYAEGAETMETTVGRLLDAHGLTVALAESCTGGLIGHRLTQVPGSSAYFDRGIISYSNEAKHDLLGVPTRVLNTYGAVSQQVAAAMASGVRRLSGTDIGLSVTGIAGPDGGTDRKPVGLVYVGLDAKRRSSRGGSTRPFAVTRDYLFHGDRHTIKLRASQAALNLLREWLMDLGKQR